MEDRRTIELSEKAAAFRAGDGQEIVYLTDTPPSDGQVLYSPDGRVHYALASRGFRGTNVEHFLALDDPYHDRNRAVGRHGDKLMVDGVTFSKVSTPRELTLVPFSAMRKPEYLFRMRDGRFLLARVVGYGPSRGPLRVFIGDGKTMLDLQGARSPGRAG